MLLEQLVKKSNYAQLEAQLEVSKNTSIPVLTIVQL